jgi:hypothetical protein
MERLSDTDELREKLRHSGPLRVSRDLAERILAMLTRPAPADHFGEASKKVPAPIDPDAVREAVEYVERTPTPLPRDIRKACRILENYYTVKGDKSYADIVRAHITAQATAQATALAEREARIEMWKTHASNHVETLRGVRDLCKRGDMERAILWVTDGLSGYTDDVESVLLMVSDQRNKSEATLARVMAWARAQRCATCTIVIDDNGPGYCAGCVQYGYRNWTPPAAWGMGVKP